MQVATHFNFRKMNALRGDSDETQKATEYINPVNIGVHCFNVQLTGLGAGRKILAGNISPQ
jgi:hypothetical protein